MGDELAVSGVEGRACEALAAFLADAPADDDVGVARFRTSVNRSRHAAEKNALALEVVHRPAGRAVERRPDDLGADVQIGRPRSRDHALAFLHRPGEDAEPVVSLLDWLEAGDDELRARYDRLYFPRNDPRYLRRNALIAAGNSGETSLAPTVERWAEGDDDLLREHAEWALERLR